MFQRFMDNLNKPTTPGLRRFFIVGAFFFTAAFGFELASFQYGHGRPGSLASVTAMLLMCGFFLVRERWLRLLFFFSFMPLIMVALFLRY